MCKKKEESQFISDPIFQKNGCTEVESSQRYQELVNLQKRWDADIQHTVNKAVAQNQLQLSVAKSSLQHKDRENQQLIQKLQDQVHLLELSLESQARLPSVGSSQWGRFV